MDANVNFHVTWRPALFNRRRNIQMQKSDICETPSTDAFGVFLRSLRKRINRSAEYLGYYRRLPTRRGLRVSQEELAEAANVSRNWYAILESGAKVRASTRLLARIADALMLSAEERAELF